LFFIKGLVLNIVGPNELVGLPSVFPLTIHLPV